MQTLYCRGANNFTLVQGCAKLPGWSAQSIISGLYSLVRHLKHAADSFQSTSDISFCKYLPILYSLGCCDKGGYKTPVRFLGQDHTYLTKCVTIALLLKSFFCFVSSDRSSYSDGGLLYIDKATFWNFEHFCQYIYFLFLRIECRERERKERKRCLGSIIINLHSILKKKN